MKQTGEILRKAREEKGLSLSEVGLALKLSGKVLKAIEDGDEKNLPAKTFVRGFVKSYAAFLRLDVDFVLETFYKEYGSTKPQPYIKPTIKAEISEGPASAATTITSESHSTPTATGSTSPRKEDDYNPLHEKKDTKTVLIFAISIVLVGLILFTKKMIDKYSKEAEVPKISALEDSVQTTADIPAPTIVGTTDSTQAQAQPNNLAKTKVQAELSPIAKPVTGTGATAALTADGQNPSSGKANLGVPANNSNQSTTKPGATAATTGVNQKPALAAAAAGTKATSIIVTPTKSTSTSATTSLANGAAGPAINGIDDKNKPIELIVEALEPVEIEYSALNGKSQKIKLTTDQVHTFKSRNGLILHISNGGAVNLIKNGKELGTPGDVGKPINLNY